MVDLLRESFAIRLLAQKSLKGSTGIDLQRRWIAQTKSHGVFVLHTEHKVFWSIHTTRDHDSSRLANNEAGLEKIIAHASMQNEVTAKENCV